MTPAELRQMAQECSSWDSLDSPRYAEWSDAMDDAADQIDRLTKALHEQGYDYDVIQLIAEGREDEV